MIVFFIKLVYTEFCESVLCSLRCKARVWLVGNFKLVIIDDESSCCYNFYLLNIKNWVLLQCVLEVVLLHLDNGLS